MNFSNSLSRRIKVGIGNKEALGFTIIIIGIGIISAIKPSYTLIAVIGLALLTIGVLDPAKAFLSIGIFLIFQAAIARNMYVLGAPENLINLIKRIDEFIWVLFIGYVLFHNYKGDTWMFRKTKLEPVAFTFAAIGIISTLVNHNSLFWAFIAIFLALKGFIMYWITLNLSINKKEVILFFKAIIYILVFAAFVGILQFFRVPILQFGVSERFGLEVAHSIFAHHGIFGSLMAVGIALTIGLLLGTGEIKWAFLTIILAVGLMASSIRRSFVGLLLGLLFVFLNHKKLKVQKKYMYLSIILFIGLVAIFGQRIARITQRTEAEYSTSTQARYWLYYGAYKIIMHKPLLGEGPGKYGSFVSVLTNSNTYEKYNIVVEDNAKMDTYWANILGEYGILGFLTVILLLLILFGALSQGYRKNSESPFIRGLYIGYIILFVDYAVESFASQVYKDSLPAFILFAGIGLLVSIGKKPQETL